MKPTESTGKSNGRLPVSTLRHLVGVLVVAGIFLSFGTGPATSADDKVPFPNGFRDWFAVNSMIVTKDSPIFGQIGGMHLVYVNAKGLPTLKRGGPFPYPDGTVFADDVHDFSVKDGAPLSKARRNL